MIAHEWPPSTPRDLPHRWSLLTHRGTCYCCCCRSRSRSLSLEASVNEFFDNHFFTPCSRNDFDSLLFLFSLLFGMLFSTIVVRTIRTSTLPLRYSFDANPCSIWLILLFHVWILPFWAFSSSIYQVRFEANIDLSLTHFPSTGDCGEKLTLSISIFVALQVFYLLLVDLIPPTSLKISLLGTYLLFTLVLVNASIFITIITLNIHWRHPNTHHMPEWVKRWFFHIIPPLLFMSKPRIAYEIWQSKDNDYEHNYDEESEHSRLTPNHNHNNNNNNSNLYRLNNYLKTIAVDKYPPVIQQAIRDIRYISETKRELQRDDLVRVCLFKTRMAERNPLFFL